MIQSEQGVRALRDLRTMHLGPHALLIVASVEFAPDLDGVGLPAAVASLHARLGALMHEATDPRLIVIEPAAGSRAQRAA